MKLLGARKQKQTREKRITFPEDRLTPRFTPQFYTTHHSTKFFFGSGKNLLYCEPRLLAVSNVLTALIFSISRNFETEGDTTRKLKPN